MKLVFIFSGLSGSTGLTVEDREIILMSVFDVLSLAEVLPVLNLSLSRALIYTLRTGSQMIASSFSLSASNEKRISTATPFGSLLLVGLLSVG